jgi:predicted RNA-binding Zn ribbon-like protein
MEETELVGNALCLDFANTVNKRPDPDRDSLSSVVALRTWATAAALEPAHEMQGRATDLAAARRLREAVYRVFSAVAAGQEPNQRDIVPILETYAAALRSAQLRREDTGFGLRWPAPHMVREITWMVAASATQLLLSGPLDRVGECPSCHWLFLDTSRGGQRRWCSMAVCGSRDKSQRYYTTKPHSQEEDPS